MDVVALSRVQFAVATYFHFLFVPLTLGLSVLVAIFETIFVRTGDEDYKRAARFWGKLFLINFSVGVVTGITLEFQFGTNWAAYSKYVGDIFGSLLAVEATLAFFLESTFIAVWFFGWKRLSPKLHLTAIWLVAIASNLSAFWILVANAFMHHPVGFVLRNGRMELDDFFAVITQKFALLEFVHTVSGAFVLAGFFVLGVSAWHLLRGAEQAFFRKSFRVAAVFALVFALFELVQGHMSAEILAETQPTKLAAMESLWQTKKGAPMNILQLPDAANRRNSVEALPVPGFLSLLATYDPNGEVKGLNDLEKEQREAFVARLKTEYGDQYEQRMKERFGRDYEAKIAAMPFIPPVGASFFAFRAMVGLGMALIALAALAVWTRKNPEGRRWLLRILVYAIPLPYLANELGWTLAEIGRQPWIVYGYMRTGEAATVSISPGQVLFTLTMFVILYSLLGMVDFFLLAKFARKGPEPAAAAAPAAAAR
ncbi:MAG TPA: cytochrome ubiquinol oxidase subunit I [Acidobacteriota bacterium]|nr:cytochrome ubiquinol oxidase subunit I [Acidobacteriota bacterium]